jgi:nucleoside 2-deoxyribosyltransferase
MCKPLVYLAGPITGTIVEQAQDWRAICRETLAPKIEVLSPVRQPFETLDERAELSSEQRLHMMRHGRSVATRDRFDVMRCDLVIANLIGTTNVSIGAVGEIFWADAYRKPVIMVREHKNVHTHAMLDALVGWIFDDIHQALETARMLLITEFNGIAGSS